MLGWVKCERRAVHVTETFTEEDLDTVEDLGLKEERLVPDASHGLKVLIGRVLLGLSGVDAYWFGAVPVSGFALYQNAQDLFW